MALKIKKQGITTYQWSSGEKVFQLNMVDGTPTMLRLQMEGHATLIIYEVDNIKMMKQFFTELEMECQI